MKCYKLDLQAISFQTHLSMWPKWTPQWNGAEVDIGASKTNSRELMQIAQWAPIRPHEWLGLKGLDVYILSIKSQS